MEEGIGDLVAAFGIDDNSDELIWAYKDALVKLECPTDESNESTTTTTAAKYSDTVPTGQEHGDRHISVHVKRVGNKTQVVVEKSGKTPKSQPTKDDTTTAASSKDSPGSMAPSDGPAPTAGKSSQNIIRVVGNGGHVMGNFILVKPQDQPCVSTPTDLDGGVKKTDTAETPSVGGLISAGDDRSSGDRSRTERSPNNSRPSSRLTDDESVTAATAQCNFTPGNHTLSSCPLISPGIQPIGIINMNPRVSSTEAVAPSVNQPNSQSFIQFLQPPPPPAPVRQILGHPGHPGLMKQLIILPPSTQMGACQTVLLTPVSHLTNPNRAAAAAAIGGSQFNNQQSITTMSMASMVGEGGRMKRKLLTKRISGMRLKVDSFIFLWKTSVHGTLKAEHQRVEKCVSFVCLECNTPFAHRKDQVQHFGRIDNDMRKIVRCNFCSFSSRNVCSLVAHVRLHRDQPPHTCFLCGFLAKNRNQFHQHLEGSHDLNVEVFAMFCLTCSDRYPNVTFENFGAFLNHIQCPGSHSNIKPTHKDIYQCKYCQGFYPNCWAVEQHMMFCKHYPESFYSQYIPKGTFESKCCSLLCIRCKVMYFGSPSFIEAHAKNCTADSTISIQSTPKIPVKTSGKHDCKKCSRTFLNLSGLQMHLRSCEQNQKSPIRIKARKNQSAPKDGEGIAGDENPDSEGESEVTTPTKRKTFICQQCQEEFPYKLAYVKHISAKDCVTKPAANDQVLML